MSRTYVFVILTLVTVVFLGVGCRTFSENVKDEAPSVEPRPSLSLENAPEPLGVYIISIDCPQ